MKVGYYYLCGTNIEVAVQKVSKSGKFALISYCRGKNKWMRNLSKNEKLAIARVQVQKTVPCECLSNKPAFTKRGLLKKSFKQLPPLSFEKPYLIDMEKDLFIWGIIKPPVKKFDALSGVVTFATTPVIRAHHSVLRNTELPTFEFEQQRTYIAGTNACVKLLEEHNDISLYSVYEWRKAFWIPNCLISSEPIETESTETLKRIGTLYLHGFIEVEAYSAGEKMLVRIPGDLGKAVTWANADVVKKRITDTALVDFKQENKKQYLLDQKNRRAKLRPVV